METKREVWVIEAGGSVATAHARKTEALADSYMYEDSRVVRYVPASQPAGDEAGWVDCKVRMPPTGCSVIVDGGGAYFDGQTWRTLMNAEHREIQWAVTHWMPWPKPPRTGEGAGNG